MANWYCCIFLKNYFVEIGFFCNFAKNCTEAVCLAKEEDERATYHVNSR